MLDTWEWETADATAAGAIDGVGMSYLHIDDGTALVVSIWEWPLLMTRKTISIDWLKKLNLTVIREQLSLRVRVEKENKSCRLYTYTEAENLS
jgi:hypothetical protein